MLAFPGMLVSAAEKAGMKVPKNPDNFDMELYPHFQILCTSQLCRPMVHGEHWENAKIIAKIPEDEIMIITFKDLRELGVYPS